ncbi:MAG TPA: hypothetical protein VGQ99_14465 [Tepidisphaeraceae bacterium]|jgi:hypothetical protein|nr:hypothetical protein [Tepidisphaeraceae bacterium]
MDPRPVKPVPYYNETPNPWPRILRTIGLCTLIFGAANAIVGLTGMLSYRTSSFLAGVLPVLQGVKLAQMAFGIVLLVAGILLLQENYVYPLMVVGVLGTIAAGIVEMIVYTARYMNMSTVSGPPNQTMLFITGRIFYCILYLVFPLTAMLILRDFRSSRPANTFR